MISCPFVDVAVTAFYLDINDISSCTRIWSSGKKCGVPSIRQLRLFFTSFKQSCAGSRRDDDHSSPSLYRIRRVS